MSCDENMKSDNCVCNIVKTIAEKQRQINNIDNIGSCETSINELDNNGNLLNTIPLLFVCKSCDYYIASGIFRTPGTMNFNCIETPVFRVDKVYNDTCCAKLELLQPQTAAGTVPPLTIDNGVCRFFPLNTIQRFIRTGIFVTFDLSCFCGVECLQAVNAQPGTPQIPPEPCTNPILTLEVDNPIVCAGGLSGTLTCNGEPINGAAVFISSEGDAVVDFAENPVFTVNGVFSTLISITPGTVTPTPITITAETSVNGIPASDSAPTLVSCPTPADAPCDGCQIRINARQNTTVEVVSGGVTTPITGNINLTINECNNCGTSDLFNFTFNAMGTNFNFTPGRRTSIECEVDEEGASVVINGIIEHQQGNNPFFTNGQQFTVTITANTDGEFTVDAISGTDEFHASFTDVTANPLVIEECD